MPKMLADGGQKSAKEKMIDIIEHATPRTWKQDKAKLLELLTLV
jgi:hypothetical protein